MKNRRQTNERATGERSPHPLSEENALTRDPRLLMLHAEGQLANILYHQPEDRGDRLRALLAMARISKDDPETAFTLGVLMRNGPVRARRAKRERTATTLYRRTIDLGLARLSEPRDTRSYPAREAKMRDTVSRAMVNLGVIYQYVLSLPEQAHDMYQQAAALYPNHIALQNIGQMNFHGYIANASAVVALDHYRQALAAGGTCLSNSPGCDCLEGAVRGMMAIPPDELERSLPDLRRRMKAHTLGFEDAPADVYGIGEDMAARIDTAVSAHFARIDRTLSIERRVTVIASTVATILSHARRGITPDEAMTLLSKTRDDIAHVRRDKPLLDSAEGVEDATPDVLEDLYMSGAPYQMAVVADVMTAVGRLIRDNPAGYAHAAACALSHAQVHWRQGVSSTVAFGIHFGPGRDGLVLAVPKRMS